MIEVHGIFAIRETPPFDSGAQVLCMLLAFLFNIVSAQPRVWLSCPPSFDMRPDRAGVDTGPCEDYNPGTAFVQQVKAGDRLKVGWLSGNRGGGFAKLALAPAKDSLVQTDFDKGLLKVTCFGYDQRDNRFSFGNCNHPCNGRKGCEYQTDPTDNQRFDTSITIPYNIQGKYVLQLTAYVGISLAPVYSCAMIDVSGGDPSKSCSAPSSIPFAQNCMNVGSFTQASITENNSAGAFCFGSAETSTIDQTLGSKPINSECDARVSCDFANIDSLCKEDIVENIVSPEYSPHLNTCVNTGLPPPVVSSTVAPVVTTNVPIAPSPSTGSCTTNPIIASGTACDINTAPITCSGKQLAQCAYVVTSTGVAGNYVFTDCAAGTTCKIDGAGNASCDFDNTPCPSVSDPIVFTTIPSTTAAQFPTTTLVETTTSTTTFQETPTTIIQTSSQVIPTTTVPPISQPISTTVVETPACPTPSIVAGSLCTLGTSQNVCIGDKIGFCILSSSEQGMKAKYIIAECLYGKKCSTRLGFPICDEISASS